MKGGTSIFIRKNTYYTRSLHTHTVLHDAMTPLPRQLCLAPPWRRQRREEQGAEKEGVTGGRVGVRSPGTLSKEGLYYCSKGCVSVLLWRTRSYIKACLLKLRLLITGQVLRSVFLVPGVGSGSGPWVSHQLSALRMRQLKGCDYQPQRWKVMLKGETYWRLLLHEYFVLLIKRQDRKLYYLL